MWSPNRPSPTVYVPQESNSPTTQANSTGTNNTRCLPPTQVYVVTPSKLKELGYIAKIEDGKTVLVPTGQQGGGGFPNISLIKQVVGNTEVSQISPLPFEGPSGSSVNSDEQHVTEAPLPVFEGTRRRIISGFAKHWNTSLEQNGFIKCPLRHCTFICLQYQEMISHYGSCNGLPHNTEHLCITCNCCLRSKPDLEEHISRSHSGQSSASAEPEYTISDPEQMSEPVSSERILVRKRGYNKVHKRAWMISLETQGHINCLFQNCNFMALSLDGMIEHYRSCNATRNVNLHSCPHCKGGLLTAELLDEHVRLSHEENARTEPSISENKAPKRKVGVTVVRLGALPGATGQSNLTTSHTFRPDNNFQLQGDGTVHSDQYTINEESQLMEVDHGSNYECNNYRVYSDVECRDEKFYTNNETQVPLLSDTRTRVVVSRTRKRDLDVSYTITSEPSVSSPSLLKPPSGRRIDPRRRVQQTDNNTVDPLSATPANSVKLGYVLVPPAPAFKRFSKGSLKSENQLKRDTKVCTFLKPKKMTTSNRKNVCTFFKNTSLVDKHKNKNQDSVNVEREMELIHRPVDSTAVIRNDEQDFAESVVKKANGETANCFNGELNNVTTVDSNERFVYCGVKAEAVDSYSDWSHADQSPAPEESRENQTVEGDTNDECSDLPASHVGETSNTDLEENTADGYGNENIVEEVIEDYEVQTTSDEYILSDVLASDDTCVYSDARSDLVENSGSFVLQNLDSNPADSLLSPVPSDPVSETFDQAGPSATLSDRRNILQAVILQREESLSSNYIKSEIRQEITDEVTNSNAHTVTSEFVTENEISNFATPIGYQSDVVDALVTLSTSTTNTEPAREPAESIGNVISTPSPEIRFSAKRKEPQVYRGKKRGRPSRAVLPDTKTVEIDHKDDSSKDESRIDPDVPNILGLRSERVHIDETVEMAEDSPSVPLLTPGDSSYVLPAKRKRGRPAKVRSLLNAPNSPVNAIVQDSSFEAAIVQDSSVEAAIVQDSSVEAAIVQDSSVEAAIVQDSSVNAVIVQDSSVEAAIVRDSSVEAAIVQDSSVEAAIIQDSSVEAAIVQDSSIEAATIQDSSVEAAIVDPAPVSLEHTPQGPIKKRRGRPPKSSVKPETNLNISQPSEEVPQESSIITDEIAIKDDVKVMENVTITDVPIQVETNSQGPLKKRRGRPSKVSVSTLTIPPEKEISNEAESEDGSVIEREKISGREGDLQTAVDSASVVNRGHAKTNDEPKQEESVNETNSSVLLDSQESSCTKPIKKRRKLNKNYIENASEPDKEDETNKVDVGKGVEGPTSSPVLGATRSRRSKVNSLNNNENRIVITDNEENKLVEDILLPVAGFSGSVLPVKKRRGRPPKLSVTPSVVLSVSAEEVAQDNLDMNETALSTDSPAQVESPAVIPISKKKEKLAKGALKSEDQPVTSDIDVVSGSDSDSSYRLDSRDSISPFRPAKRKRKPPKDRGSPISSANKLPKQPKRTNLRKKTNLSAVTVDSDIPNTSINEIEAYNTSLGVESGTLNPISPILPGSEERNSPEDDPCEVDEPERPSKRGRKGAKRGRKGKKGNRKATEGDRTEAAVGKDETLLDDGSCVNGGDVDEADDENEVSKDAEFDSGLKPEVKSNRGRRLPKSKYAIAAEEIALKRGKVNPNMQVKCEKCGKEMAYKQFAVHNKNVHYGFGWMEGDLVVDMKDLNQVRYCLLRVFKPREKKSITCEFCGSVKRSVEGFISHLELSCQKSAEEQDALKLNCPVCDRVMLPSSLKVHIGVMHKSGGISTAPVERESLGKRAAATKAEHRLQECMKEDKMVDGTQMPRLKTKLYKRRGGVSRMSHMTLARIKKQLTNDGTANCRNPGCTYEANELETLKRHYESCKWSPVLVFNCLLCSFYCGSQPLMDAHLSSCHADGSVEDGPFDDNFSDHSASSEGETKAESVRAASAAVTQSPSSYKLSNRVKFLAQEVSNQVQDKPFVPAAKWTVQFQDENYSACLFPGLVTTAADWQHLDLSAVADYLPATDESMSVSNIHMEFVVRDPSKQNNLRWRKWRLFEADLVDGVPVFFAGGPVWATSWCPIPTHLLLAPTTDVSQYLAVSCHRQMDDVYQTGAGAGGHGLIQLWDFGHLDNTRACVVPKMALGLAHDHGAVWHMEWCPSGCYELDAPTNGLRRLGLLAAACSDGSVHVFSVPFPSQLQNNCPDDEVPIFTTPPVMTLRLHTSASSPDAASWMCTRLSWYKGAGHQFVAGSFTNGMVAVWDLLTKSPLLTKTDGNTRIIYPFNKFQAHDGTVSALSLFPYYNCRYLMTGGIDRYTKIWDLEATAFPITSTFKGLVTDGVWLPHWVATVTAYDDCYSIHHTNGTLYPIRNIGFTAYPLLAQNSPVWSISGSEWTNAMAQGTVAGELSVIFPHQLFIGVDTEKGMKNKRMVISFIEVMPLSNRKTAAEKKATLNNDDKTENEKPDTKTIDSNEAGLRLRKEDESSVVEAAHRSSESPRIVPKVKEKSLGTETDVVEASSEKVDEMETENSVESPTTTIDESKDVSDESSDDGSAETNDDFDGQSSDDLSNISDFELCNDKEKTFLPEKYDEVANQFRLAYCNFPTDNFKKLPEESKAWMRQSDKMRVAPTEMYPITSVNRVDWNPNCRSFLWLAAGYQCGLVRVPCVSAMQSRVVESYFQTTIASRNKTKET